MLHQQRGSQSLYAVGNFIERPILHDPADINRSAECCHDKTDVAGNEVIGIEDGAIQYSNIGERSVAQNAGKVAEDESEDQCSVDGIDVEEAELFMQHRDDDLIDGNGGSQGGNDEQQEEPESGLRPALKSDGKIMKPARMAISVLMMPVMTAVFTMLSSFLR